MAVSTRGIQGGHANNNLPFQSTPFIGRERELESTRALLRRDGVRLVTLTGPGGAGKTRLGLEVARSMLHDFQHGIFFVALAPITDPSLVAATIAQELGIMEAGSRPIADTLKSYLRDKHMLLVLDNFEQILDAVPFVAEVLMTAPRVKVLATSRSRLRVRGEHEFPVPPLSIPLSGTIPSVEWVTRYEAVRLFVDRASALMPDFDVNSDNAAAVAEICTRLDGLPLAIELAAARIKILSPADMLSRMGHRLRLLTGGEKDLPVRQQTLRNTIEWSYDLLDQAEKTLFRRLSVFSGSFDLDAIESVCQVAGMPPVEAMDVTASLVDKSLIRSTRENAGGTRFSMLETIQEYAREKLEESGETNILQRQHAEYFVGLAERAEPQLRGSGQVEWSNRLEAERDNVRSAMKWSLAQGHGDIALRLGGALHQFWKMRGHFSEGRAWLEDALANSGVAPVPFRARAIMAAGTLAEAQGDYERARVLLGDSLILFRKLDDKVSIAATLRHLGNEARHQGDYGAAYAHLVEGLAIARELGDQWDIASFLGDLGIATQTLGQEEQARAYYEESLAIRRELNDRRGIAMMLVNLGELARAKGDYDLAHGLYQEGLTIARELGDRWGVGMVLHNLGHVAYHRDQYGHALDLFAESLRIFYDMRNKRDIAYCLAALAGVYGAMGQPERAAVLFSAGQALSNTISSRLDPADLIEYERNLSAVQARMSPEAWESAWAQGQAMTLIEAVAYALEGTTPAGQSSEGTAPLMSTRPLTMPDAALESDNLAGLSTRELEVLRLVAAGLTDNQVAEQLIISPRTVHRHLSSIYSKLGVSSRTAAVRLAAEQRLV